MESCDSVELDRFLQFLARAEGDLLAGLDLHRFPGLRIAAYPRFAPLHLKNSEPDDTDFVALHEVPGDPVNGVGRPSARLRLFRENPRRALIGMRRGLAEATLANSLVPGRFGVSTLRPGSFRMSGAPGSNICTRASRPNQLLYYGVLCGRARPSRCP